MSDEEAAAQGLVKCAGCGGFTLPSVAARRPCPLCALRAEQGQKPRSWRFRVPVVALRTEDDERCREERRLYTRSWKRADGVPPDE